MVTINEMIYNTITTKKDKEPKYKKILEALGYSLNNTHDWSEYNYWGIDSPGGILLISKDYGGKKRLYLTATPINNAVKEKIRLVDFENLLTTPPKDYKSKKERTAIYIYKNLKQSIEGNEWLIESYEKQIAELEEKLKMKKQSVERIKADNEENKEKIKEILEEKRKRFNK